MPRKKPHHIANGTSKHTLVSTIARARMAQHKPMAVAVTLGFMSYDSIMARSDLNFMFLTRAERTRVFLCTQHWPLCHLGLY